MHLNNKKTSPELAVCLLNRDSCTSAGYHELYHTMYNTTHINIDTHPPYKPAQHTATAGTSTQMRDNHYILCEAGHVHVAMQKAAAQNQFSKSRILKPTEHTHFAVAG